MRAMAILYIGPHRNPDFANDYHLSPLLAPSHLLAQFPPLLMSCGEKDPFVDDTVIFAGRVREAKRTRKRELDVLLAGPGLRLPESLRMSVHHREESRDDITRSLRRERDRLASQGEEDWVTMQIFSDWSHGYLQMPMLMSEARTVIYDMADWIDETFVGGSSAKPGSPSSSSSSSSPKSSAGKKTGAAQLMTVGLPNGMHTHVQTTNEDEDRTPFTSETEVTDTDDVITFVPKRRSPPGSFGASSSSVKTKTPPTSPGEDRRPRGSSPKENGHTNESSGEYFPSTETLPAQFPLNLPLPPEVYLASSEVAASHRHQHHRDHSSGVGVSSSSPILANGGGGGGGAKHTGHLTLSANGLATRTLSSSPPRVGTPGKAGPTITESELMRRRRLLDSHLIPNSPVGDSNSSPT